MNVNLRRAQDIAATSFPSDLKITQINIESEKYRILRIARPKIFINILGLGAIGGLRTCHSPFSYYFKTINGILQDLTSFDSKFSIPECSIKIPVKISSMLFQSLQMVISILLGPMSPKITTNLESSSHLILIKSVFSSFNLVLSNHQKDGNCFGC